MDTNSTAVIPSRNGSQNRSGKDIVARRHPEWSEGQTRWRWLLDSFEAGNRYRNATYGPDRKGLPARNLIRHKREYPDPAQYPEIYQGYAGYMGAVNATTVDLDYGPFPGSIGADPAATSADDNYEMRRARTPVPEFVAEAVETHISKIYEQEVRRDSERNPEAILEWWNDVDGRGTSVDDWMADTIAPLLLVVGFLDILFDHPKAPPGVRISTQADVIFNGLDRCVASYILPENMVWWKLDPAGRYSECLVREYIDPSDRKDTGEDGRMIDPDRNSQAAFQWRRDYCRFRHWTAEESVLYGFDGREIETTPHAFGRVPIVRVFDRRKHRTPHVGKSRYEAIAEYQREYYNRDSELILSDTLQASPLLSGPEDFCTGDSEVATGPDYILPKKRTENGYEGWEFISPSKDPAESIRKNKMDLLELKDRAAALTKPAGATGTAKGTVGQSGISKTLDATTGNKLLAKIAKNLARAEREIGQYALLVLAEGAPDPADLERIEVVYPSKFDLFDVKELGDGIVELQGIAAAVGRLPQAEALLLQSYVRRLLIGLDDPEYEKLDEEIEAMVEAAAAVMGMEAEMRLGQGSSQEAFAGSGSAEADAGVDPTGLTGETSDTDVTASAD